MNLPNFHDFLDSLTGDAWVKKNFIFRDRMRFFERWYKQTGESGELYPSQGLLMTPYDYLTFLGKTLMGEEELWDVIRVRQYLLEVFNHPERLAALAAVEKQKFIAPGQVDSPVMDYVNESGLAISVRDLGAIVEGANGNRVARRQLLKSGPFVKLGKYGRIPFASGAMPDVFGAPAALATMAASHALACLPRNGVFSHVERQVALASATFDWLEKEELLEGRQDKTALIKRWRRNLVGVIEPELTGGMKRAEALYKAGVRTFRVYSPEPGVDAEKMVRSLRKEMGRGIEIFVGQVAMIEQAQKLEEAGADGLYVGIGGGGRCITAVRSSSVVDWPNLLWQMRGVVHIPVIVEGGASDHVGVALLLGASGIGVSRLAAGGTIESPGGLMYLVNKEGEWFKPYGGEASARTKYQDGKMLALGMPAFVEGETTKAIKSFIAHIKPTVAANLYFLVEDVVLSLVFRGVGSISELQALNPSPLRRMTLSGELQQNTH